MKLDDAPGKEDPVRTRSIGSSSGGRPPTAWNVPDTGRAPTTQRVPHEPSGHGQATTTTNPTRPNEQVFRLELQALTLSHATFGTAPEHEQYGIGSVTVTRDQWVTQYERATELFIRVTRSGGF